MLMAGQMHPPFLFWSCQKRNGPCTVQKKRPLRRAPVQWPSARRGSAYRCKRRFCLAFGHAWVFCQVDTAVPWRMVPRSSGCKDAFDQLLFPRVPLARKGHAASVSGKAANGCAVNSACAEVLPAAKRSYGAKAPPARRPVGWFSYTFSRFQNIDFNRPFQNKRQLRRGKPHRYTM